MARSFRIGPGGRVDTARPLAFTFDGRRYQGCLGDTLASALIANGVHLVGRSFKYHRPRGILSAGPEEPNALVTVDRGGGRETPNLRATQVELYDGLVARSQNRWPSLAFDAGGISDALSPLFGAGFYYKTFMGPRPFNAAKAWANVYEPLIRRAAGLGKAPAAADPDRYANRFAHCDVLIIGAGPAGLAAALAAAESGARVILCDEQSEMGGSLLAETEATIDGKPALRWAHETIALLARHDRVRLLRRTTAFGAFAQGFVALAERLTDHLGALNPDRPRERLWQVRAKEIVLAAGALERPLVFPGNDRPGIMLADAARTYVERYRVRPGLRAVVLVASDRGYQAAISLRQAGVDIALLADIREHATGPWPDAARAVGLPIETATVITATGGRRRVRHVMTGQVASNGRVRQGGAVKADLVLMSGGWTPSVHLLSQARGRLAWSDPLKAYVPAEGEQPMRVVGGARGTYDLAAALGEGYVAGAGAAKASGASSTAPRNARVEGALPAGGGAFIGLVPHLGEATPAKAFVDFQNDVTAKDLKLAAREGFRSIEHVKRYTTTGMATDQGKTSNLNAIAIVADATGRPAPEVGLTTYRQPYTPVTFGTLAGLSRGSLFDPVRTTPTHAWATAHDAVFEDVGQWKRARYFPKAGEDMHAAVKRECRVVRARVGLFDGSTLGKIEVVGPDAGEFLERMYVNTVKSLAVGRCRYVLMLNEAGFVIDDGIIGRLAPDRFHVTTTTGGAARVLNQMEDYLQTEWPDLKVWLTSVTEQWAVIALQGPLAWPILARHAEGIDLATDALPHMGVAAARVAGVEARLFRVSFTGEAGYEINVPASEGLRVWEALWTDVAAAEGVAYGTETMHVLRAEKGFIIVGQETDGTVTPEDVGLYPAAARRKRDFVGKRSLARADMVAAGRKQLVGLLTERLDTVIEEGAQVTAVADPAPGTAALGHVTSSYWSEAVGRSIALALVANGRARLGERLYVPMPDGAIAITVVSPVFYDEQGARLASSAGVGALAAPPRSSATSIGSCRPDPVSLSVPAERVRLVAALTGGERRIFRGPAETAMRASAALALALPLEPCRATAHGERAALWLGPDEWLLLAPPGDAALARLSNDLAGFPYALVTTTDRQVGYALDGPDAAALLGAGCPLDLDAAAFPVGMATRTLLAKAEIVLWRTAPQRFHIEVARSLAPYLEAYLAEASRGLG